MSNGLPQASSIRGANVSSWNVSTSGQRMPITFLPAYADQQPAVMPDATIYVTMHGGIPAKGFTLYDAGGNAISLASFMDEIGNPAQGYPVNIVSNRSDNFINYVVDHVKAETIYGYPPGAPVGMSCHIWCPSLYLGGNSDNVNWQDAGAPPPATTTPMLVKLGTQPAVNLTVSAADHIVVLGVPSGTRYAVLS